MSAFFAASPPVCPTAHEFAAAARRRAREFALWTLLLALATGGCIAALGSPVLPLAVLVALGILIAIGHSPRFGVLLLFGIALVMEADRSHFPPVFRPMGSMPFFVANAPPMFRPLQEVVPGCGVPLSGAEFLILVVGLSSIVHAVFGRRLRFRRGTFLRTFLLLIAWWILAAIHGITSGGDAKTAFIELRSPLYVILLYLLSYNLMTQPGDLDVLGWMILVGTGLRSLQCLYLYLVTFHRDISWSATGASILEHHDSFLLNGFFFYALLLFLTKASKPQQRLALALLPLVAVANVLNSRRASTAATVLSLLVLVPMLYAVFKERRAAILRMTVAGALFLTIYAGLFWNSHKPIAAPIRAIRSQFEPDARDASSDAYRKAENKNILYTIQQSPILGYGFGKEFLRPVPMIDLRKADPYLFVLPHNSILWVWLRLGLLGFLVFWFMNGQWIAYAGRTALRCPEVRIRRWSLFAMVLVVINLVIAYLDMGLYGPRINIYLGIVLGILDRLPLMAERSDPLVDRQAVPIPLGARRLAQDQHEVS